MSPANLRRRSTHEMRILGHSFDEYAEIVRRFHGNEAPGVIIGGIMVDLAVRSLPDNILYDAVCETNTCLPDAVQILTPCTIGNGWLKIAYTGRFAMTLYDKQSGEGVRVFLDAKKVEAWPEIKAWYFKLKPKKEQDREKLNREIQKAGDSILTVQHVRVRPQITEKKRKGNIAVCPECGEAYPADDGETCPACRGNMLYL